MTPLVLADPFARCLCGSFSLSERPCEENVELLLARMRCDRCGDSPLPIAPLRSERDGAEHDYRDRPGA